ncbi:MAG: hypothetical protein LC102_11995 [Ignavibacteriales bacterium]|jgi:hypothetical protein|nr:MAG: hypothetical protein F9K26_11300 [Ignavibacteriaceae bacterium]MBW7873796.1 hypothetical protein [Ignavibacteria bacterium]MCZ2144133.1 hypothetical protein [Ignavibacteriales bacterium]OQY76378.1 MAG: hypothetical protein B6D45_03695 [Ignavibacteriales bacterium UTCHB3]MBV6445773.1 hypothetical protein [Ignavibacteriaceae bacterium]
MKHYDEEFFNKMLDDEITAEEKELFFVHIKECTACREQYRLFQSAHTLLLSLTEITAPEEINNLVLKKIMKPAAKKKNEKRFFITVLSGLTVMLLAIFGIVAKFGGTEPKGGNGLFDNLGNFKFDTSILNKILSPFSSISKLISPDSVLLVTLLLSSILVFFLIERTKKN